jgi:hypothetical protein
MNLSLEIQYYVVTNHTLLFIKLRGEEQLCAFTLTNETSAFSNFSTEKNSFGHEEKY